MSRILTLNPTSSLESPAAKHAPPSLRVVAIGGGTGLSTLLRGLKRYVPATIASRRATDAPPRVPSTQPNPAFPAQPFIDRRAESTTRDRKSTRLNSSHLGISYAVFCLK